MTSIRTPSRLLLQAAFACAKSVPFKISKNIVDLGDGTYAVEFRT
jgi:hypothetical protein